MKLQGIIQDIDHKKKTVVIKFMSNKLSSALKYNDVVDLITNAAAKHELRKKIFSLIDYLWQKKNFEIFGTLKNEMKTAVEKTLFIKGEQYAKEFYRFNIHLECNFTNKTIGIFPTDDGNYTRMIGEVAKSLSNASGVTVDELFKFYKDLQYLILEKNGHEFLEEWEHRRDI